MLPRWEALASHRGSRRYINRIAIREIIPKATQPVTNTSFAFHPGTEPLPGRPLVGEGSM